MQKLAYSIRSSISPQLYSSKKKKMFWSTCCYLWRCHLNMGRCFVGKVFWSIQPWPNLPPIATDGKTVWMTVNEGSEYKLSAAENPIQRSIVTIVECCHCHIRLSDSLPFVKEDWTMYSDFTIMCGERDPKSLHDKCNSNTVLSEDLQQNLYAVK